MGACRQKCWIAGGAVGLAVLLALVLFSGASILTGLLLGAIAAGLMGSLLVWGLCEGRGSAAENDEVNAAIWQPEPFTPSRRVVAPGGRVVEQRPINGQGAAVPAGLAEAEAPLERVTLQPSREPGRSVLVETPAPAPAPEAELPPPPSETVALLATPSVASVIPVAPIAMEAAILPQEVPPAPREPEPATRAAATATEGERVIGADRVATITGALPHEATAAKAEGEGELLQIKGVGPMLDRWLRDNGVTRLAQIAAWDDADIGRFAGMMGRNGHRIRSEDWVGQARALIGEAG